MHFNTLAVAATLAATVSAHTRVYSIWVNGVDQGDGRSTYIRSPPTNDPVKDLSSANLVCNVNGGTPGSAFVTAAAGDTLTFEWYHNTRGDDIIDSSHKGPIITYIAPYTEDDGASPIWTKIDEEGLSGSTWAVDNLISNSGKKDVTLPSSLAAGKYLIRTEIIALHEADVAYNVNSARGAQFYPSCAQLEVTGSGTATPDEDFDFNTGYTYSDPGIVYNLYAGSTTYTIPGPAVWTGSSSGSSSASATTTAKAASTSTSVATSAATSVATSAVSVATSAVSSTTKAATSVQTTLVTSTKAASTTSKATSTTAAAAQTTSASSTGAAALYQQCGGRGFTGPTTCSEGTCKQWNEWYFQCVSA
ncbi:glycosyl hydrolase family 61-domain-containing protein [Biscogniauxia mediterranea]|nr:glycosyl hydrolase family 61-domain-containing protein [Biscogniauxia mediterranea]